MQKSKVLVCDRPFKCPVCRRDFVIGDEIIMLLPQKTRYCSQCGTAAIQRLNRLGDTPPTGFDDTKPAAAPWSELTAKPAAPKGDFVERAIHSKLVDKVFELEKKLNALESRLDALEQI